MARLLPLLLLLSSCATLQPPERKRALMVCRPVETGEGIGLFCVELFEDELAKPAEQARAPQVRNGGARVWTL